MSARKKYLLKRVDGSYVGSPTHTTTSSAMFAAVFGGSYGPESDQDTEATKASLESTHGPLEVVFI